jgi:hypothetical protein
MSEQTTCPDCGGVGKTDKDPSSDLGTQLEECQTCGGTGDAPQSAEGEAAPHPQRNP